jgi:hypothetical protein
MLDCLLGEPDACLDTCARSVCDVSLIVALNPTHATLEVTRLTTALRLVGMVLGAHDSSMPTPNPMQRALRR